MEIRCAIECFAARTVVQRASEEDIENIVGLIQDVSQPVSTDKARELHEQKNRELHELLVALSGNRKMLALYKSLNTHISMARVHYASHAWKSRLDQERQEHQEILLKLQQRDGPGLAESLRRHIQGATQALVDDIRRNHANV